MIIEKFFNVILRRDLANAVLGDDNCKVQAGALSDPYTGQRIAFKRGANSSGAVQIDHVVALSNAWQTGAQQLSSEQRISLANDPLELLAVDGPANQQKGCLVSTGEINIGKIRKIQH